MPSYASLPRTTSVAMIEAIEIPIKIRRIRYIDSDSFH
ncbi:hypothetical protein L810_6267 [Burkholderia sp. AU4i]|nr:hypothetical protein L810_6267 [Burkholderia sp. AU4i]